MKTPTIALPIQILTPKMAPNKQDSLFYAGKNIAQLRILNREYVLTTSGMYDFAFLVGARARGDFYRHEFKIEAGETTTKLVKKYLLTDARIKKLTDDGALVSNWGWFGINVWENSHCMADTATDVYSEYDEAMAAFITFIQKDLKI